MTTKEDQAARAAILKRISIEAAELSQLAAHPKVEEFFRLMAAAETQRMLDAAPEDDDTRRGAALMLQCLQKFKGYLATGKAAGEAAGEAYADFVNNQDEG